MSKEKFKYTKEFLEKVKNGDIDATTLLYEDAKNIAYKRLIVSLTITMMLRILQKILY